MRRRDDDYPAWLVVGVASDAKVRTLGETPRLKLAAAGGAVGLALAVVASRLLDGLLFGTDALDPLTFLGVPVVLGAAALSAT